jgi:AcrR family transcriptional regulator
MSKNQRFSKSDWIEIGEFLLKSEGPDSLVVDRLCEKAKRTKGSFYHHFRDTSAYLQALIDQWEQRNTLDVIEKAAQQSGANRQLETLNELTLALDLELEIAIRQLAGRSQLVGKLVQSVDQKRLQFLEDLYISLDRPFAIPPRRIAELEYSAFLGSILLWPKMKSTERSELSSAFTHLLIKASASET